MLTSNPPRRCPSRPENTAGQGPLRKMPAFDPTRRIILRRVMLSGGKIGVKKGLCRYRYRNVENCVERACKVAKKGSEAVPGLNR